MTKSWISEAWRLALGLFVAFVAGLITGYTSIVLIGFLLLYAGWMIFRFAELEQWLRDGGSTKRAPDVVGTASEIMQLIHRHRKFTDKRQDRLRASLTRFNDMAAELPDATIVLNENRQIIWANAAASSLMGIQRKRDQGQRIDNLIRDPAFLQFLQSRSDAKELEINPPSNPDLTLALRLVPSGEGSILSGRDVTQRVLVREMRKAFVANVSHELRTPLTVINGYLELINDENSLSEQTRKALANVGEQADRMSNIVEELLTLSRLESSNLNMSEGEAIDIQTLVNNVIAETHHPASRHSQEMVTNVDDTILLFAKQNEIYSAVQNLVQNALRYTQAESTITIVWRRVTGGAVIIVADNGPGISPKHLPRLSERFYRVDTGRSRESGGTGLGLAIVKYIAQRHGGQLNIRSNLGKGSEFELSFPSERVIKKQEHKLAL